MTPKGVQPTETQTFEQMMERLEALVKRLESSNLSLDESIQAYEEGTKLVKGCRTILDQAEKKIQTLTQEGVGSKEDLEGDPENKDDELPF